MNEFKVGDLVTLKRNNISGAFVTAGCGNLTTQFNNGNINKIRIDRIEQESITLWSGLNEAGAIKMGTCCSLLLREVELINAIPEKKIEIKKAKWAITYKKIQDHIEYFVDTKDKGKRVGEILNDPSVDKNSIIIFEIAKIWKAKQQISFEKV